MAEDVNPELTLAGVPKQKPGPKPKSPAVELQAISDNLTAPTLKVVEEIEVEVTEAEPTIGRIVEYTTHSDTVRPAIITRIHGHQVVDLTVFNSEGAVPAVLVEKKAFDGESGVWSWPKR